MVKCKPMILELLKKLTYIRKICFKKFDHVRRSSFFNSPSKMNISADSNLIKPIAQTDIEGMTTLKWGEHCVECAAPECYKTCDMFIENDQGKCRRFLHGIKPSKNHAEIRPQSSEIVFLPWSNLLADIQGSLSQYDGFLLQIYNPTTETVPILFYLKGKEKN